MFESILIWLAERILNYLLGRAVEAAQDKVKEIERDKERGEINEANVKAYEEAADRESRRREAVNLLNRSRRS